MQVLHALIEISVQVEQGDMQPRQKEQGVVVQSAIIAKNKLGSLQTQVLVLVINLASSKQLRQLFDLILSQVLQFG